MARQEFNSNEVRLVVPVRRGDLQDWIAKGYLIPSSDQDAACGKSYLWNHNDIYKLALLKNLIDFGLSLTIAHKFLEVLPDEEIRYLGLVESDNRLSLIKNLKFLSYEYRFIMWVNFEQIKQGVDNKIKEIFG